MAFRNFVVVVVTFSFRLYFTTIPARGIVRQRSCPPRTPRPPCSKPAQKPTNCTDALWNAVANYANHSRRQARRVANDASSPRGTIVPADASVASPRRNPQSLRSLVFGGIAPLFPVGRALHCVRGPGLKNVPERVLKNSITTGCIPPPRPWSPSEGRVKYQGSKW